MLKKLTLSLLVLFMTFFFSDYVMSRSSSPPAGNTNAPNEQTCAKAGCHAGNLNSGPGSLSLSFDASDYSPGSTHTLTATVNDSTKMRYGFQVTVLDGNDSMMGSFVVTNATNTVTSTLGSREYMGHKSANGSNSWSFDWMAPAAGMGTVTFYMSGNAADSSGNAMGDNIYADTFNWDEGTSSGMVSISGPSEVCEDGVASFTATSGFTTYLWSTGDTTASTTYPANSSGSKTIWVVADFGLGSQTADSVNLMVHPTPDGPIIMDSADMDEIHISNVAPGSTYQWYKNTSKMTGETDTTLQYTEADDYHVEVTDSNGCMNTSNTVSVTMFVGIGLDVQSVFNVYPNPSSGIVNISNAQGFDVQIMNVSGQIVQSVQNLQSNNTQIELASGLYFIRVQNEETTSISKVVVR